jgi:hypothetical protein
MQPSEYWQLDSEELSVLGDWMRRVQKEQEEANR